jgi:imidazoleglycerol-phosphate dehydratase/histidinol-phosphatase
VKRALFIDRDQTIIAEPEDKQIDSFEKLEFLPKAISTLARIRREFDYEFVMVTNQDGLGTASFPEETFWPAHNLMLKTLKGEGVEFDEILIDRSLPADNAPTRKPRTGMLGKYLSKDYDLANSFVIGDRLTDIELATNLGAKAIFLSNDPDSRAAISTPDWNEVYRFLVRANRSVKVQRKTSETEIEVTLTLDGEGRGKIQTGLGFFDHMLDQIARHSGCDLEVAVKGDLHIDEHHTIEDTSLTLGEAIYKAIGKKYGIGRYGFTLPMDDALATVALDLSGRSWLVWNVDFKREKIGDVPTEMFFHFFKSLTDAGKFNLNIQATGENEHHKIESVFKAFARAFRQAVARDESVTQIPSTKGIL